MRFKDLSGKRFSNLIAEYPIKNKHGRFSWSCLCNCGNRRIVEGAGLTNGKTKSCGCLKAKMIGLRSITHGHTKNRKTTPEYRCWNSIKERCLNPKCAHFKNYGGRGISLCERWKKSFQNFYNDMGKKPALKSSIERKNNHGNYCPSNCVWADRVEQANNNRHNRVIKWNGIKKTASQWALHLKINPQIIYQRLHRNWPLERVMCAP